MATSTPATSTRATSTRATSTRATSTRAGATRGRRWPGDPPHLFAAAIPSGLGVLLLVLGWVAVSGKAAFDDQMVGLNLAILGAIVVLVGCGFYLWVFRRRIERRVGALRTRTLPDDVEDEQGVSR